MHEKDDAGTRLESWRRTSQSVARGIGLVALAFSLVVGMLLLADWRQAGQAQTVRATALSQALSLARQAPSDAAAVAFARDLDRLARHAYFSSVTFQQRGMILLALGLLVAVGFLHIADRLGRRIEDPRQLLAVDPLQVDRAARWAMLAAGLAALTLAVVWRVREPPSAAPGADRSQTVLRAAPRPDGSGGIAPTRVEPAPVTGQPVISWPCFRGPACGVSPWTNAPVAWNGRSGAGVVWKREVTPAAPNSPVLWGERIFLTTASERERLVLAFDLRSGAELWRQAVTDGGAGAELPTPSSDTGLAASSAACDALGVYAVFGTGDLVAFTHDGRKRWQLFLRRPDNPYGHASSLLADGGRIYVQYDQREESRLLALDAATGKIVWEVERDHGPAWSSPVLTTDGKGQALLVVNGHEKVSAFAPLDGRLVWETDGVSGEVAPSPAVWHDRLYLANAYARLVCYTLASEPQQQWTSADALPDVASPVAADGLLFVATSDGALACLDATDGREQWRHSYDTGFYASPILCGDRLYALDRDGVMRIVAAQRVFREIAGCPLGEAADATPAFGDGCIILRSRTHLWRVGGAGRP